MDANKVAILLDALKLGSMKNAALPTTAVAISTDIITSCRAPGLLRSNLTKKGTIANSTTPILIIR